MRRDYLADPCSVRDAEISGENILDAKRGVTSVCIKANAKNAMGYTGRQTLAVRLQSGQPVASFPNRPACNDPAIKWYPFRELEALKKFGGRSHDGMAA